MKIQEAIDKVVAYHPDLGRETDTDVLKYGDPEKECSGIAVTCFGSSDVIRKAAEKGANLLIVHEPLFWNHPDQTGWLQDDLIYQRKKALLDETGMVVYRDHDRIHGSGWGNDRKTVDGIFYGIMKELGWEDYLISSPLKPLLYKFPERDATELGIELKEKLGLSGLRIVGDPHAKVSTVYLCEHVNDRPSKEEGDRKVREAIENDADAFIPLECIDWTLSAYVRDSSMLGRPRVLYNTGHFNLEELGMKYLAECLQPIMGDTAVEYIPSGDSYGYIM